MKINDLSLPHPVLGYGSDVKGKHSVSTDLRMEKDDIYINAAHKLINKSLQNLIKKKKASFCTHVHCKKTFFREVYNCHDIKQKVTLPQDKVLDRVEVEFYVTAQKPISNYKLDGFHPDYKGARFQIEKGDVLSYGGSFSFIADKEWVATKGIANFMTIQSSKKVKGRMEISLDDNKILILIPTEDYQKYQIHHKTPAFEAMFHSSIVLPTLIYALSQMFADKEAGYFSDFMWYQCLEERLQNDEKLKLISKDAASAPAISQAILDNPLNRTLVAMDMIATDYTEET